jgi:hypothetical protein
LIYFEFGCQRLFEVVIGRERLLEVDRGCLRSTYTGPIYLSI